MDNCKIAVLKRNRYVASSCNLGWDTTSSSESSSNTRCADQPYLIAEGCVCVHIGFHSKNRLSGSICAQCAGKLGKQGSS